MKKIILIGIIIIYLSGIFGVSGATEYYINNSGGNNSLNNGTFNNTLYDRNCEYVRLNSNNLNGMVSYWPMLCYDYDNITEDVSNISLNDGVVFGATFNLTNGVNGTGCFEFDGDYDFINFGRDDSLNLRTTVSWMMWVKRNELNESQVIMSKDQEGWVKMLTFELNNSIKWLIKFDGEGDVEFFSTGIINNTDWHLIAGTYNQTHVSLYIDGVIDISIPTVNKTFRDSGGKDLYLGENGYAEDFNGSITQLVIYSSILSESEIYNEYNSWIKNKSTIFKNIGNITYENISIKGVLKNISTNKIINRDINIYINEIYECNLLEYENFCVIDKYYNISNLTFELLYFNNSPAFNEIILNIDSGFCRCLNCSHCQKLIDSSYCTNIFLTESDFNYTGINCIIFNNSENKIFNCNANIITGNNNLQNGFYIFNNSNNISILNCIISNFQNGIKIQSSTINKIENNIICNNWEWDIIDWDKMSYGKNNTASKIHNFADIGYINLTTYQCIIILDCVGDPSLIAVYLSLMFIIIILGLYIDRQLFYILFGFVLFMLSSIISNICNLGFLWFTPFFIAIYFFYSCILNKEN